MTALLVLALFLGSGTAYASASRQLSETTAPEPKQNPPPIASMLEWKSLQGKVRDIDLTQNVVRIQDSNGNIFGIQITESVQLLQKDGQPIQIGDLKENDKVVVQHAVP